MIPSLGFALVPFAHALPAPQDVRWTQAELERVSLEIQADIERLRGERFLRPVAVRISSKADLVEYMKLREAKSETPEKLAADELIAKLLGAVPASLDLHAKLYQLMESQVGGFYDPDTDSFSLMESLPRDLTRVVLAHELDHALDDQLFDIDGRLERVGLDTDAILAFHCVVEGSGTAVMNQWTAAHLGELDLSSMSAKEMQDLTSMADAPMWLWKPLLGAYMAGSGFLQRTDKWVAAQAKPANSADIRAAFEKPPVSTEQILHPEKYWDAAKLDEPRTVRFDAEKLEDGWAMLREDTLGELMTTLVCTPEAERTGLDAANPMSILGVQFDSAIGAGWDGDRVALAGRGDSRVLRWVSVWDSERDAGEFFGTISALRPTFEAAAKALSDSGAEDSGASVEYGGTPDQVVVTVHVATRRTDLRRVVRSLGASVK